MPDGGQLVVRTYNARRGRGAGPDRHRLRHGRGDAGPRLRRLLFDKARRLGPGTAHRAEDHRSPRRPHRPAERAWPRHAVHDLRCPCRPDCPPTGSGWCICRRQKGRETMLSIRRIDSRREDIRAAMAELRRRLSPEGDVVSEAGRQRTIEVFGEPLSPAGGRRADLPRRAEAGPGGRAGLLGADRQGAADGRNDPRARRGTGRGPRPGRRRVPGRHPPHPRAHPRASRRRSCTTTSASKCPAAIWSSAIGRWIAWAFACRAGRPPIPPPC